MKPVTTIVTALAIGAAANLHDDTDRAVKEAYTGLKALIVHRFTTIDLALLEAKPDSKPRQAVVEEELQEVGADQDLEVLQHALTLLDVIEQTKVNTHQLVGVRLTRVESGRSIRIEDIRAGGSGVIASHAKAQENIEIRGVTTIHSAREEKDELSTPSAPAAVQLSGSSAGKDIDINTGSQTTIEQQNNFYLSMPPREELTVPDLSAISAAGRQKSAKGLVQLRLDMDPDQFATIENAFLSFVSNALLQGHEVNIAGIQAGSTIITLELPASEEQRFLASAEAGALDDFRLREIHQAYNLYHATFYRADLHGNDLQGAKLNLVNFFQTDLSHAQLAGANLRQVTFLNVDLSHTDFSGANFRRPVFHAVDLSYSRFIGARLDDALFVNVDLTAADFTGARLQDPVFIDVFPDPLEFVASGNSGSSSADEEE